MKSKKLSTTKYLIRLDKGEKLIASLQEFAKQEKIGLAEFRGLGFTDKVKLFIYKPSTKGYDEKEFAGRYEITSLWGLITDEEYTHTHVTLADETFKTIAGHLSEARIAGTAEIVLDVLSDKAVDRFPDKETGLNLLRL